MKWTHSLLKNVISNDLGWLSDLAKYLMTWSIARLLCDSWASCNTLPDCDGRTDRPTNILTTAKTALCNASRDKNTEVTTMFYGQCWKWVSRSVRHGPNWLPYKNYISPTSYPCDTASHVFLWMHCNGVCYDKRP